MVDAAPAEGERGDSARGKAAAPSSAAPPRPARDPALRWWTVGGLAAASVALGVAGGVAVADPVEDGLWPA